MREEYHKQVDIYNDYLDDYTTFMPIGGELIEDDITNKQSYENARFVKDKLAANIKVANNEGTYPTNIYELYQVSITIPDFTYKYRDIIYRNPNPLTDQEMNNLVAQINIGFDVDTATSDEVNAWLEKVVNERMIIEGKTPPK